MIKPYFETELGKLYCGDCLEIMPQLEGKVDLILTDPFYVPPKIFEWKNFDDFYWDFNKKWLTTLKTLLNNNFHIFIFFSSEDMARFELLLRNLNFNIKSRIVWHYRNAGGRCRAQDRWGKTYEFIFHCSSGKLLNFSKIWDDKRFDVQIISMPQMNFKEQKFHKYQKPIELIKRFVEFGSIRNEILLDPFLGSGTTAIACERLGRHWIGIEINKKYCDIAVERIERETTQYKLLKT